MTQELADLRGQALALIGTQPENGRQVRVLREMFDAGLAGMTERLLAAESEVAKARAGARVEAEKALLAQETTARSTQALADEKQRREELIRGIAQRERDLDARIVALVGERDAALDEAALCRVARDTAEQERRHAEERARLAAEDAAAARSESAATAAARDDAEARAAIALGEAANARIEKVEGAARARLETTELRERLAAALAERTAAFAARDKAERERAEMYAQLSQALAETANAAQEAAAARARAVNAAGALRAVTGARITFVGDAHGEVLRKS